MKFRAVSLALASLPLLSAGCQSIACGDGTTERGGKCVPASETVASAKCGPFTELRGDLCVPMFPPTMCDPATTAPDTDEMGVTTCVATGVAGCSAKLACPTPAQGMQTVCGQIYDFETNQPFAEAGAKGTPCAAGATAGPCSLAMRAYDAANFASSPPNMATVVATGTIDDCGRYTIPNIPVSQIPSQIVLIGTDDSIATSIGPAGTTNAVGLATPAASGALKDFDAFVVPAATSTKWANSGGPGIATGILAAVYHGHSTGSDLASGVTFKAFRGSAQTTAYYLSGAMRSTVDPALSATAQNGTALVTITNPMTTDLYFGQGGIDARCMWGPQPALTLHYAILVEGFRPVSAPGMACPL